MALFLKNLKMLKACQICVFIYPVLMLKNDHKIATLHKTIIKYEGSKTVLRAPSSLRLLRCKNSLWENLLMVTPIKS